MDDFVQAIEGMAQIKAQAQNQDADFMSRFHQ